MSAGASCSGIVELIALIITGALCSGYGDPTRLKPNSLNPKSLFRNSVFGPETLLTLPFHLESGIQGLGFGVRDLGLRV